MPEAAFPVGICATCTNASSCAFTKNRTGPVMDCEEFDSPLPELEKAARWSDGSDKTKPCSDAPADEKGLCGDCSHRANCAFSNPEGGTWHCEEYA